mmetsp:Transcript_23811/g.48712  ORF Transcript_23811/g.48712 Transcript_23811/m.48712 type:complete len:391 (-) Transcript_23811:434-1606(-)
MAWLFVLLTLRGTSGFATPKLRTSTFVSASWAKQASLSKPRKHHRDATVRRGVSGGDPTEEGGALLSFLTASQAATQPRELVGEDAAVFDWNNEEWGKLGESKWLTFLAAVGSILSCVGVLWVYPATGYSDDFQALLSGVAQGNSHVVSLLYGLIFPLVHSGLAGLRPYAEPVVGARAWRVVFAFPSLCLSFSWIAFFISHAHDGVTFWDLQANPVAHALSFLVSFASFFFLYPTVFNLKEVAAVEAPKVHLWETGVIRITRHPQMVGQVMWSVAHLAMVGTSFTLLTMFLLVGHHVFSVWHGDRRLLSAHGDKFTEVARRTSVVPFAAILDGRQVLPPDYWKELVRAPYALIAVGTAGAYFAHPYMQAGAALVQNTGLAEGGVFDVFFN